MRVRLRTMLKVADSEAAAVILNQNLWGYGQRRLAKLPPEVVVHLCNALLKTTPSDPQEQIEALLKAKRKLPTPTVAAVALPAEPAPPSPPPPAVEPVDVAAAADEAEPAFRERLELRIVSLNALKLRVETAAQKTAWQKLFKALADEDVIVLQEIPAGKELFHRRTAFALEALNTHTTLGRWALLASEPSGASAADRATECHVLLYQTQTVEVVKATTLHLISQLRMCHAPLAVHVRSGGHDLVLVSVHLPPDTTKRRADKKAQLQLLLKQYAVDGSLRFDLPFTNKGAKDAKRAFVTHMLLGDWNSEPAELQAAGAGFEALLRGAVPTTTGGKSYDNVLLNRDALEHWSTSLEILELTKTANFARGVDGVSDHAVVRARLSRSQAVGAARAEVCRKQTSPARP